MFLRQDTFLCIYYIYSVFYILSMLRRHISEFEHRLTFAVFFHSIHQHTHTNACVVCLEIKSSEQIIV
jgi:hypothetical protein